VVLFIDPEDRYERLAELLTLEQKWPSAYAVWHGHGVSAIGLEALMDANDKQTVSRRALYDLVWSKAVTKLAADFGLSDVGFAKLCKRNNIPRPPRGYWAMLQVGKAPPKPRLPMPSQNWDIAIAPHKVSAKDLLINENGAALLKKDAPVVVAETLHDAHLLVKSSIPVLRIAPCDNEGVLKPVPGCLHVCVSKPRLRRALLIMDALIRIFEKCGFVVKCSDEECATFASIRGVDVPFKIDEYITEKRRKGDAVTASISRGPEFILHRQLKFRTMVPAGRLALSVDVSRCRGYNRGGLRFRWSDGTRQRIEDHLEDFVAAATQIASVMKVQQDEWAKWEQERNAEREREAEAERHRFDMVAKIRAEQKRVDELMGEAEAWQDCRRLRDYIEAVKMQALEQGKDVGADSETGKWLAWAEKQADRLDPLKESPASILDEAEKYGLKEPHEDEQRSGYPQVPAPYTNTSDRRDEFFRKRWLYQRFRDGR